MNARFAIAASIGLALAGCNGGSPARTIHGQINVADYGLHQPVVLVESSSHLSYVAQVAANGGFRISVPSGQSYRLTLADRTGAGSLALTSHILWTFKGQSFVWAKVQKGATINFGTIRPMNAPHTSPTSPAPSVGDDQGENDDSQCDEDDDAQGDEQGPTGTSATCQPPMTPPSNPPVCMPGGSGGMGNSSGDQDENCDQDDDAQGDDDRDGNGGSCDGGMSGDDNNQGDDNAQGNEDEDDGDGSGCVKHVPTCPPAGGGGGSGGSGGGGTGTPDMGPTTPPASPDMSTGGPGPIG